MVSVLTRRGLRSPYRERTLPDGRRVYWKVVRPEHEVTTPAGCAVDEPVLDAAERRGLAGVGLLRARTNEELWAPLSRWRRGIPLRRGFGPQRELLWRQLEPLPGGSKDGGQLPLLFEVAQ
jgi:hypothetical protein